MQVQAPQSNGRPELFTALALAYLLLPNLIFLTTWVRPAIGLPAALLVTVCFGVLLARSRPVAIRPRLSPGNLLFVLALAFYWTLLAGAGGFVPQVSDYLKNNLLYHDLVHLAWPVTYAQPDGTHNYLCYGLGYYLPPAWAGRLLGDAAMPVLTFLWLYAGVALFFYWVATFNQSVKTTLLVVLLFAATHPLLLVLKRTGIPGLMDFSAVQTYLRDLGLYHSYYDFFTKLQYQPQYGIPGLLGVALFYDMIWENRNPRGTVLVWSAWLFWSPIASLALLLIPLAALRRVNWRGYFEPLNLLGGGVLLAVMGVYFQGHLPLADHGAIWNFSAGGQWLWFYLLFVLLELSPVLLLWLVDRKYRVLGDLRPLFLLATAWLLLLPLYKFGHSGDQRLQAGTPALVLAALGAVQFFYIGQFSLKRPLMVFFVVSLLVGAAYPLVRPWWNLATNKNDYSYVNTVKTLGSHDLSEFREPFDPGWDITAQYQGRADCAATRWLLRPATPVAPR
jgi:hypothetical protein